MGKPTTVPFSYWLIGVAKLANIIPCTKYAPEDIDSTYVANEISCSINVENGRAEKTGCSDTIGSQEVASSLSHPAHGHAADDVLLAREGHSEGHEGARGLDVFELLNNGDILLVGVDEAQVGGVQVLGVDERKGQVVGRKADVGVGEEEIAEDWYVDDLGVGAGVLDDDVVGQRGVGPWTAGDAGEGNLGGHESQETTEVPVALASFNDVSRYTRCNSLKNTNLNP